MIYNKTPMITCKLNRSGRTLLSDWTRDEGLFTKRLHAQFGWVYLFQLHVCLGDDREIFGDCVGFEYVCAYNCARNRTEKRISIIRQEAERGLLFTVDFVRGQGKERSCNATSMLSVPQSVLLGFAHNR